MQQQPVDYLLVGGGLASASAAETLRKQGAGGRIVMVGAEADYPYNRPPLSKDYLRGETPRPDILVQQPDFYREQSVEVRSGEEVESIDPAKHSATLRGGGDLSYRRLLIATGAELRLLPVPGGDASWVHYLRVAGDSDRIREAAGGRKTAVAVGGGFIGAEVAASLTQMGVKVTIIEQRPILWAHVFGEEMGRFFHQSLVEHGIEIVQDEVAALEGPNGRGPSVRTKGGRRLDAEMVVVGIGVSPRTQLATAAGLQAGPRGIRVDEFMRTSDPDIFAAGDCVEFYHPLYRERMHVEHWQNAIDTGEIAALAMMGRPQPLARAPYFYSDLFDIGMEYLGHAPQWDDLLLRGRPEDGSFGAYYVREGKIVAALHVNNFDETDAARALVESQAPVAAIADRLRDKSAPLSSVAGG